MKRFLPFLIILVVAVAAVMATSYFKRSVGHIDPATARASVQPAKPDPFPAPGADPPHAIGPADAPVVLEEFGDFECAACANFSPMLKSVANEFKGRVRIVFREFPMFPQHQRSVIAARVAEAAGMQDKFWEMHDRLYQNREVWSKATDVSPLFEQYANEIGLDVARFKKDVPGEAVRTRLAMDLRRARTLQVKGTPTVYLNGTEVSFNDLRTIESLRKIVRDALKNDR